MNSLSWTGSIVAATISAVLSALHNDRNDVTMPKNRFFDTICLRLPSTRR